MIDKRFADLLFGLPKTAISPIQKQGAFITRFITHPTTKSHFQSFVSILVTVSLLVQSLVIAFIPSVNDPEPEKPTSNHVPQITVPAPSGLKVNTWNGNLFHHLPLLSLSGRGPAVALSLSYNSSWFDTETSFGPGWQFSYTMYYTVKDDGDVVITWQDGRSQRFDNDGGNLVPPADTYETLTEYASGKYRLSTPSKMEYYFDNSSHKKLTSIKDPIGNVVTLAYSGAGNLSNITDAAGREITFAYQNDKLTQITDGNVTPARTIHLQYAEERLSKVIDPKGNAIQYQYDEENFLTQITDQKGVKTNIIYSKGIVYNISHDSGTSMYFTFDREDRLTSVITLADDGNHPITRYQYDEDGRIERVEQVKNGRGDVNFSTYVWDDQNNLTSYTDERGHTTSYTYDDFGNILTITDPLNRMTEYEYDPVFQKVTSIKDARQNRSTYEYDSQGNITKITDALTNETTFAYNDIGKLETITDANGNVTTYFYNEFGYRTVTRDALENETEFTYDAAGRVLSVTDANGNSITYEYDANGNQTKTINPLGYETTTDYDAANQPINLN